MTWCQGRSRDQRCSDGPTAYVVDDRWDDQRGALFAPRPGIGLRGEEFEFNKLRSILASSFEHGASGCLLLGHDAWVFGVAGIQSSRFADIVFSVPSSDVRH